MRKVLVAFATVLVFLAFSPATVNGNPAPTVTSYLATEPVTIDGKWTSRSEWNDTAETKLTAGAGTGAGYFRIKHDATWLYVLAESLVNTALEYSSTTEHGDFAQVFLDTLHDDGKAPKTDDYKFYVMWVNASYTDAWAKIGTGTDWGPGQGLEGLEAKIGLDTGNSPHSPYPHAVGEVKIPLSIIQETTFGFFVRGVSDSSDADALHLFWDTGADPTLDYGADPSTWGNVILSTTAIPEFSAVWLIVAATMLAATVIFRSKKRGNRSLKIS